MPICSYCNRQFKNNGGLASHLRSCQDNPERSPWKREAWNKGKTGVQIPWNKGKTKETDLTLERVSKKMKGRRLGSFTAHSEETKSRLSEVAKERNLGGYVRGAGRGKKGWYKGIFCDSSWELAFVIYCIDHEIPVQRCDENFEYEYLGKIRQYRPDFKIGSQYIEIKGYKTKQWEMKLLQFPHPIKVLYETEMKKYIDYAKKQYGNYLDLYEEGTEVGSSTSLEN